MSVSTPTHMGSEVTDVDAREVSHHARQRRRIPAVPDLRFEYSYTRSILPYVHVIRGVPHSAHFNSEEKDAELEADNAASSGEVVEIQWRQVVWITARDQVITPLVQGALWGVASQYVYPAVTILRQWWARGASHTRVGHKDGEGVGWLRGWLASLTATGGSFKPNREATFAR